MCSAKCEARSIQFSLGVANISNATPPGPAMSSGPVSLPTSIWLRVAELEQSLRSAVESTFPARSEAFYQSASQGDLPPNAKLPKLKSDLAKVSRSAVIRALLAQALDNPDFTSPEKLMALVLRA